jgi:CheY-like chemotaxis protein
MPKKEKILILAVDDEADIRAVVQDVLEDAGFEVVTASSGLDMLKKMEDIKPSLILLDVIMPGLTTKEILAELKKRNSKIPIIFLTAVRLADEQKEIITKQMADYIEKPFENKDFIKRVKKALK